MSSCSAAGTPDELTSELGKWLWPDAMASLIMDLMVGEGKIDPIKGGSMDPHLIPHLMRGSSLIIGVTGGQKRGGLIDPIKGRHIMRGSIDPIK